MFHVKHLCDMAPFTLERREKAAARNRGKLLVHRLEEIVVVLRLLHLADQEFHGIHRSHRVEDAAQDPHFLQCARIDQKVFLPRAGFLDVDGRIDALVGQLAVEAVEFLVDKMKDTKSNDDFFQAMNQ